MIKNSTTLLIGLLLLLNFACKTHKIKIHGTQKFISLKLIDEHRYKYLYYNLGDTAFVYNFNQGRYSKNKNNVYKLFPNSIKQDNYQVDIINQHNDKIGNRIRIRITTDLLEDYSSSISILTDSSDVIFHGTKADTTISNLHLKRFRVKVGLATKYVRGMGNQLPTFTSITSNEIVVGPTENDISIHIPVSFSTYFYKYQKEIDLKAVGTKWETNGYKIQMRNIDF
nr:hypothetical protein [Mucilaginibacter sp. L294]